MAYTQIVQQFDRDLTPSEERLYQELLFNKQAVAFMTAAEVAALVGVHESTVVRLAQKLGYKGYRDLRSNLQEELSAKDTPVERLRSKVARSHELSTLVSEEIIALQELLDSVPQELIDQAARMIIPARLVYLFGWGHASTLVEYMDRRLRRAKLETVDLRGSGRDLAEHILAMGKDDILLAFGFHLMPPNLESLLRYAHSVGAKTILISDDLGPIIRPRPTILIAARRSAKYEMLGFGVPMTIANALVLSIAQLDEGRTFAALEQLDGLLNRFESSP
jgi:DNA-binding MurR/RpiR family transcriptional regulator